MTRTSTLGLLLLAMAVSACEPGEARIVDRPVIAADGEDDGPRLRRVWADAGDYASPSPDGRMMTWVDWSTGDVAVYDVAADERRRITDHGSWTENGSWAEYPKFGPRGERVVYSYGNVLTADPFRYELRYVELGDTTQHLLRPLGPGEDWIAPLDWTERGILFTEWHSPTEAGLFIVDPASGEVTTVEPMGEREADAFAEGHISPDGRYVVYTGGGLHIRDLRGGGVEEIAMPVNSVLGWTPGGRGLLVHTSRDGHSAFFRIPLRNGAQAGEPMMIHDGVPAIQHGGARAGETYYYRIPVDAPRLHLGAIDLDRRRVLEAPSAVTTPMDGGAIMPIWSHDGSQLAYLLRPLTSQSDVRLMVRSADGRKLRELRTLDLGRITSMGWAADGSEVYLTQRSTQDVIGVSVRDGGMRTVIEGFGHKLAVSPDGRTVAAARESGPGQPDQSIVVGDLRTGRVETLHTFTGDAGVGSLAFRDEGTLIYVWRAEGQGPSEVRTMPVSGGSQATLVRLEYPAHFELLDMPMDLTPDSTTTLMAGGPGWEGPHSLYAVDLEDGTVEPLDLQGLPEGSRWFSLHPDGNRLAFVDGEARGEVWALDQIDE